MVISEHTEEPAILQLANDRNGDVCAAIVPGDGDVVVEKDGRNVLEGIVQAKVVQAKVSGTDAGFGSWGKLGEKGDATL